MEIDLDRVGRECREFMSVTPSKAEFLALLDRLRSAEKELAELRAYKKYADRQKPVCVVQNKSLSKLAAGKEAKVYGCAPHMLYNPDYHSNLYASPSPNSSPEAPQEWREIVNAVAHVGVDFGFGAYDISDEQIAKARELLGYGDPSQNDGNNKPDRDKI